MRQFLYKNGKTAQSLAQNAFANVRFFLQFERIFKHIKQIQLEKYYKVIISYSIVNKISPLKTLRVSFICMKPTVIELGTNLVFSKTNFRN